MGSPLGLLIFFVIAMLGLFQLLIVGLAWNTGVMHIARGLLALGIGLYGLYRNRAMAAARANRRRGP